MASGDGSEENAGDDSAAPAPPVDLVEAPHRRPGTDPAVDHSWLARRQRLRGGRFPRWSTVLLVVGFVAVLSLYLLLPPI